MTASIRRMVLFVRCLLMGILLVALLMLPHLSVSPSFAGPPIAKGANASNDSGPGGNGSSSPGSPKPWIGGTAGLNLATGNKLTSIPLVGWKCRGGMSVGVTFFHNSAASLNSPLAVGWNMSYESCITFDGSGNATLGWDDGSVITFTKSGSNFVAPQGEHGTFSQTSTSPVLYEYVSTGQTHYVFTAYSGTLGIYLTKIYDLNGNSIVINRPSGTPYQISTIVDPTNRTLTYSWSSGRLSQISDPLGRLWTFGYEGPFTDSYIYESGDGPNDPGDYIAGSSGIFLQQINLPVLSGQSATPTIAFGYSTKTVGSGTYALTYYPGTISTITDPKSNSVGLHYDPDIPSVLRYSTDPMGITTHVDYTSSASDGSGATTVTDPNGHASVQNYVNGVLQTVVDATNTTVGAYTYDTNNNVYTVKDGRGLLWKYFYDGLGINVSGTMDPDGHTTSTYYNSFNEPTSTFDKLNHGTYLTYDSLGNLNTIKDPLNHTSTITVPAGSYGLPSAAQDAVGNTSSLAYDTNGNVNVAYDANGVVSYASYNALNWLQSTTDALGNTTAYGYDNWGRLLTVKRGGAQQQPLYRLDGASGCVLGGTGTSDDLNRMLTADSVFFSNLLAGGWQSKGTAGYIYLSLNAQPGLVALHRLQSGASSGQQYYSADSSNISYFVGQGWTDEGVVGYVYPASTSPSTASANGYVPLYAAWNSTTNRNLFTNEYWEYTNLASPWQKQGVVCYLQGQAGSLQTVATYVYDLDGNVTSFSDANGNGYTANYDADNRLKTRTNTRGNGGHGTNDTVTYTYDLPNPYTSAPQVGLLTSSPSNAVRPPSCFGMPPPRTS